jgi:hypothetical protein
MNRSRQNGVALVITLIMLSVVTFMAVTFLALSRRERNSVAVTASQTTASLMSEMALARVQGELATRVLDRMITYGATNAISNLLTCDLMVSTNLIDPRGFNANITDPTQVLANVNYDYDTSGKPLDATKRAANIARLKYDARPPVYFSKGTNGALEFRYYVDLNRNGLFDTNGYLPVRDKYGHTIPGTNNTIISNYFVGDPEWIGVLQYPTAPHSATNPFIGRLAWIALPSGKSLDINYIHNRALEPKMATPVPDRFARNQGVGTWELNLAAFLRDLNTNQWAAYDTNLNTPRVDPASSNANSIVAYRYNNNLSTLPNIIDQFQREANNSYNNPNLAAIGLTLQRDYYDAYGSGPRMTGVQALTADPDTTQKQKQAWPGGDNTNNFYDIQELLDLTKFSASDVNRMRGTFNNSASTYDRYTYYRLLAQLGVDSSSGLQGKMNLNYANDASGLTTNYQAWTPLGFFTNAAARLLSTQPELSFIRYPDYFYPYLGITNIPVYPTNYYTPAVHRLLQVAANIYDASTNYIKGNRNLTNLPSVFRPVFRRTNDMVVIAGYVEETGTNFLLNSRWIDLASDDATYGRRYIANKSKDPVSNVLAYGVPVIFGAKKGLPNFNEFSMQTAVQVTRKLEFVKNYGVTRPRLTNQLFLVGVSNAFGLEAWNSYTQAYPRNLQMTIKVGFDMVMTTNSSSSVSTPVAIFKQSNPYYGSNYYFTNIAAKTWQGKEFRVPLNTNTVFLSNMVYTIKGNQFQTLSNLAGGFEYNPTFTIPSLELTVRARLLYYVVDTEAQRVVDLVMLDNLGTTIDVTKQLIGNTNNLGEVGIEGSFWRTNLLNTGKPEGVQNQIAFSLGEQTSEGKTSDSAWVNVNADAAAGDSKDKAIDLFRVFVGLAPKLYQYQQMQQELGNSTSHQAPFSPARKLYQNSRWQVNDPLVHYLVEDLIDLDKTNSNDNVQYVVPITRVTTNSNLGAMNRRYRPWGGNPNLSGDTFATDISVKDSMIKQSDDWAFPTNKFPNVGWLGRVHRGTPWQTIYLKSAVVATQDWAHLAGPAKAHAVSLNDFTMPVGISNTLGSYNALWMGNYFTHPTNDWRILDLFTTALNDNASRGRLSVNQTNLAAWSAVLSGVSVLTNTTQTAWSRLSGGPSTNGVGEYIIQPNSAQLKAIVTNINQTRLEKKPGEMFHYLGEVLSAPALTVQSPFLSITNLQGNVNVSDEVIERIPQQVLSLLKSDEPRVTVYTFGQTLSPAPNSRLLSGANRGLCTNYQVIGEVVAKHVLRLDGTAEHPTVVRERFQYLPND